MYLSLNNILVAGRVPWPEFAQLAARVGFRGVDVKLDAAMSAGVAATRRLLNELKIRFACNDFFSSPAMSAIAQQSSTGFEVEEKKATEHV
jgi:hypothetical protein